MALVVRLKWRDDRSIRIRFEMRRVMFSNEWAGWCRSTFGDWRKSADPCGLDAAENVINI